MVHRIIKSIFFMTINKDFYMAPGISIVLLNILKLLHQTKSRKKHKIVFLFQYHRRGSTSLNY